MSVAEVLVGVLRLAGDLGGQVVEMKQTLLCLGLGRGDECTARREPNVRPKNSRSNSPLRGGTAWTGWASTSRSQRVPDAVMANVDEPALADPLRFTNPRRSSSASAG